VTTEVRVSIATTAGAIDVERIAPVALRKSKVFAWRGLAPLLAISASYDDFVRKRVARILPVDAKGTFRIDLSGEIDTGDSWQLAVLVAHALHRSQRLAGRDEHGAPLCLYATGTVDFEMAAGEVGYVEDKLRLLIRDKRLQAAAADGRRVVVAIPEANGDDARPEQEQLRRLGAEVLAVGRVEDLLHSLGLDIRPRGADPTDAWEGSPFRGLDVFDVRHSRIFWGRGKAREEALQVLRRQDLAGCSFLLVHGSSGVGKSSLARAGLLADLEQTSSANDRWRSAVVLPSRGKRSPIVALAEALASVVPGLGDGVPQLASRLLSNPAVASESIVDALTREAQMSGRLRVALLVDQLEGLLLWAREENSDQAAAERDAFAETLSLLARTQLVWVIATLRSDLMSLLEDSAVLSDLARSDRLYRLERPRPGALAEIIRRPAELAGLGFIGHDKDNLPLMDVLTDAAKRQQDCLPLLQFTLKLLYDDDQRPPGAISYAQYERTGGLEDAIGGWADKTMKALGEGPEIASAVDDVIFNLARRGRDTDLVVGVEFHLEDGFVTSARGRVIEALDRARLIVVDADPKTHQRTLRIAHEALLTHWARARTLFETHGAKLALKNDLERSAMRWREEDGDDAFLILGEAPLVEAEQLLRDSRVVLSPVTREFIEVSVAAHRNLVESLKARLARDEQKVDSLVAAAAYRDADTELERIADYLSDQTDTFLGDKRAAIASFRDRVHRLAKYDASAKEVFPRAGQEEFELARLACHDALHALGVLDDSRWWENLPVQDLRSDQVDDLRQEIYRLLLLYSGLQLVPGIRCLFPGRVGRAPRLPPAWLVRLTFGVAPHAAAGALKRHVARRQLLTRQDNKAAQVAFDRCRAALREVHRVEQALWPDGRRSRTSALIAQLCEMLAELSLGPKGEPIDPAKFLAVTSPAEYAEPINAADYFFIALFNYFVAKRRGDGAVAMFVFLLRGNFAALDARAPLATAERLLRAAVAQEPRNFWPHWVLGRTLQEAGDHAGAELAFNSAVALEPRYARGYEQRGLSLAKQWARTKDDRLRDRARADSELARRFAVGDPSIYWPRGELFDELGDTKEALNAYSQWLELEENVLATVARGAGVGRLFRRANKVLADRRLQALHADAQALLGLVHWTWKDYSAALAAAHAALDLVPGHGHARALKGAVLLASGKPREALAHGLEQALASGSSNFWALLNRARALEEVGSHDEARSAWQAILAQSSEPSLAQCPPWMLAIARANFARLSGDHPGSLRVTDEGAP